MPRWAAALMVLALGGVPLASAAPVPAPQLPAQHCPPATPGPAAPESPPASPSGSQPGPRPGPHSGPRITLSLDVPLGLQQIVLAQARARALREQAAANAHILARVGRR